MEVIPQERFDLRCPQLAKLYQNTPTAFCECITKLIPRLATTS